MGSLNDLEAYQQRMNSLQHQMSAAEQAVYANSLRNQLSNAFNSAAIAGQANAQSTSQTGRKSVFKEIGNDVKGFIAEHRSLLYFVVIALLVDHFLFRGAFKDRLQGMAEKFVKKVEEKVEKAVE